MNLHYEVIHSVLWWRVHSYLKANSDLCAHTRSRKCHFLRQLLLLQLKPVVMVTISKCTYQVQKMVLLQLSLVVMVATCTEHTRSGKCHFLRLILLLQRNIVVMVNIFTEHTRSGKCHFLRHILLLQLNPFVMVKTCTKHTGSRKMPLLEADPGTIALPSCNGKYMY